MAKPKELTKDEKDEAAELETSPGSGETMSVNLKGPAAAVTRRLGLGAGENADPKAPSGPGTEKSGDKFFDLLQDPALLAVVTRTQPPVFNGIACRGVVDRYELPEDWQSIKDQVAEGYGGGKYRVALINPQNGRTMAADRFEVPGDPILPEVEDLGPQFEEEEPERSPLDRVKDLTNKEIENATSEAELIAAKRRLEALRSGKSHNGERGTDPRIEALERQIADAERRALEEKHQREIDELKRQIEAKAAPTGPSSSDRMFEMMMQQMKSQSDMAIAQQKSSDEKFTKMMEMQNQRDRDAVLSELRELKRNKDEGGLKGQIEMVKTIADLLGVPLGGEKDEDEDKPWYEKLAEDSLPRIIDLLEGKRKDGKTVTKEDLIAEIEKEADRVIAQKTASGQLPAPARAPAPRGLPPAAPPKGSLPAAPPPAGTLDLPPPPPGAAPAEPQSALPSVDEERVVRCANVMVVLERELMFRPKEFQWNFIAWQNLPEELLEKVATAADLPIALAAFEGILNPDGIAKMRTMVTADDRVKAWVSRGFKELQGWWQESLKNPNFDPADDGEEEGDGNEQ